MKQINIEQIIPGYNPRKYFDMDSLKESIREKGILMPITVRPQGDKFEIVCGESRYRCAVELGLSEIPCIVREFTDQEAATVGFLDNKKHNSLTTVDQAEHHSYIHSKFGWSAAQIAKENTLPKSDVIYYWQIAKLSDDIKSVVRSTDIGFTKLYHVSKMLDKESLIKVFEESAKTQFNGWTDRTTKDFEKELFYREECQLQLIRRIINNNMTRDQVKSAVTSYLNEFKRRDDQIRMETDEKLASIWSSFNAKINDLILTGNTLVDACPEIELLKSSIPDEIIDKTGGEVKDRVAAHISELVNIFSDKNLEKMRSARVQLIKLNEQLRM